MVKQTTKKIGAAFISLFFIFNFSQGQDISTDAGVISQGEGLFNNNCTQCHAIGMAVVGPDLNGVTKRRSIDWIKAFVTNSGAVIASGDKDAVKLFKEYNGTDMPAHNFSGDELNALVAYLHQAIPPIEVVTIPDGGGAVVAQEGNGESSVLLYAAIILVLLILVVVLGLLSKTLKTQLAKEDLNETEKELINQKFEISYLWKASWIRAIVIILIVLGGLNYVIDFAYGVGIQQGYAPSQPINFSHKIHAGDNEIDCNYCHTGVRKSKNANIPSANICMNCHSAVKTESDEIKKIYKAIETNRPIEWVRVHNLPDLVYFNHSQHVQVGGVECQTCHGPIEEMEVVRQENDLTMGWCISCHKETPLNTDGNAYYDDLVKKHEELNGKKDVFQVADNGGMECARCHY